MKRRRCEFCGDLTHQVVVLSAMQEMGGHDLSGGSAVICEDCEKDLPALFRKAVEHEASRRKGH